MADLHTELRRRKSLTVQLEEMLKARPGEWISMRELAAVGGLGGWRTRLSELGRRSQNTLRIEHNKMNGPESCHRYVPDASEPSPDRWSMPGAPYGPEPYQLAVMEAKA